MQQVVRISDAEKSDGTTKTINGIVVVILYYLLCQNWFSIVYIKYAMYRDVVCEDKKYLNGVAINEYSV